MEARVSVAPSALRQAWQDGAASMWRQLQPQILQSPTPDAEAGAGTLEPSPSATGLLPTYNRLGRMEATTRLFAAARWEHRDSIELRVQTAEGDVATLSLSHSTGAAAAAGVVRSGDGSTTAVAWDEQSSAQMELSVEGDLNDLELAAIDELAAQLKDIAEDFFDGDPQAALQRASEIGISDQADTLSAFSYSMRSLEVLAATALYGRVAQAGEQPATPAPIEPVPVAALEEVANDHPVDSSRQVLQQILALLEHLGAERQEEGPLALLAETTEPGAERSATGIDLRA